MPAAEMLVLTPRRLLLCLTSVVLVGLHSLSAAEPARQRVTLLHTSDIHGRVLAFDDLDQRPARGSLTRVATLVAGIRASTDNPVLLLDSGDTIQGTPLEEYAHVRWAGPSPTVEAMSRIGYLAMAVGNHEFNFGLGPLRAAEREAGFPFLSANVIDTATGEPAFPPFLVVTAGAVRVGVLGLTTPNVPGWEIPAHYSGLRFEPMDNAARRWVERLRGQERCDLVVVLAHTGLEGAGDTADEAENWGRRLAAVPGIDVLLTGHTHRNIAPFELDGVIVAQPGARARFVTRIDLDLERRGNGWTRVAWHGENLPTADIAPEEALEHTFDALHARVVLALDHVVATTSAAVDVTRCRLADCAAVDLIHATQLEATGAELSLASLLDPHTPTLDPGPVTRRWVESLYVFANSLVVVRLTGAEVADVLEHAARWYDGLECAPEGCVVLADPRVAPYNVDTMAGLSYGIDARQPEGHRVHDIVWNGRLLDPDQSFTVAVNSYRAAGGGGFPHLAAAERVRTIDRSITDLIAEHLEHAGAWTPRVDANWSLAPVVVGERPARSQGAS